MNEKNYPLILPLNIKQEELKGHILAANKKGYKVLSTTVSEIHEKLFLIFEKIEPKQGE